MSVWKGCIKLNHTAVVRLDEVLKEIFGWMGVASGTTFDRYFKRFGQSENQHLFLNLYQCFFEQINFDNYALDLVSSVITRYGEQQGAKKATTLRKEEGIVTIHYLLM